MPDLSSRSEEIEIMDDLNCSGEIVNQTLRELDTINHLLGGNYVTLNGAKELLHSIDKSKTITLVDLGCGSGDMLRRLSRQHSRSQIELIGIDANPNITAFARAHTHDNRIRFETLDIFSEEFRKRKFDIIIGTLFFHHFTSDQLVVFFSQLKYQANVGIVINDIHRHPMAYYSIKALTQLLSKSPMVKFDAPLSVRRAFRKKELVEILKKAEIKEYSLRWMWAFRWQIIIKRGT